MSRSPHRPFHPNLVRYLPRRRHLQPQPKPQRLTVQRLQSGTPRAAGAVAVAGGAVATLGEVDTLTTVAVRADTPILVIVIMITTTCITTTTALMTGPLTLVAIVPLESLRGPDPSQELVMNVVIPVITLGRVERPRMFAQCLDSFSE